MRVLHITNTDLQGRAFNGYNLMSDMQPLGVKSSMLVIQKESDNPHVHSLLNKQQLRLHHALFDIEKKESLDNIIFPWAERIVKHKAFIKADLVHYHLFHNRVFSTLDFPELTTLKPSVWTIHDPWFFTGHCIQPLNCDGWQTGCRVCPHLDYTFPLKNDSANKHWNIKSNIVESIQAQPLVASDWMQGILKKSPIGQKLDNVKTVPFGVDIENALPDSEILTSRKLLRLPLDSILIFFRSDYSYVKGVDDIIAALDQISPSNNMALVTVGNRLLPRKIRKKFQTKQFPWTDDRETLFRIYNACDIFLMPSTADAFGMMAVEAMAAGRPIIVAEGTALPSTTNAPEIGIVIPRNDSKKLREAIHNLVSNKHERIQRGLMGRKFAQDNYRLERFTSSLSQIYRETIQRHVP